MLCIENVNKITQILKGKYCYLQLWEHSKGEGEQKIFFICYLLRQSTKFCKDTLEFCKIFSWAVKGNGTQNILWCMWDAALVLENCPWEASLRKLGIKLSNSSLLKEMRKSNIVLQIFYSL